MLSGMAIPGDSVGEEDVEGASSDGCGTPPHCMLTSLHSLLSQETLERRGSPENDSIKGME